MLAGRWCGIRSRILYNSYYRYNLRVIVPSGATSTLSAPPGTIQFRIRGQLDGKPFTPPNVDLSLLRKLLGDVERLLLISKRKAQPPVALTHFGTQLLEFTLQAPAEVLASLTEDLNKLMTDGRLDAVRFPRARVLHNWQMQAHHNASWQFELSCPGLIQPFVLNYSTQYAFRELFYDVEVYFYGVVSRMGGKSTARVHIRDEKYGMKVLRCKRQILESERINRLYRFSGLHARGRMNALSGKMDKLELIRFVDLKHTGQNDFEPEQFATDVTTSIKRAAKLLRKAPRGWLRNKGVRPTKSKSANSVFVKEASAQQTLLGN